MFGLLVGFFIGGAFLLGIIVAFFAGVCYKNKEMRKRVKLWYDKIVD